MKEEKQASESEKTFGETKTSTEKVSANGGDSIKETLNKAKESAGQAAAQVSGKVQEKATELVDKQKINLAAGITAIAESVRHIGENLQNSDEKNQIAAFAGQYGDTVAQQIERFSHYVEDKNFREIVRDTEQFARRNPTLFVGGAFALGILAARIFKSSGNGKSNGTRFLSDSSEKKPLEKTAGQPS